MKMQKNERGITLVALVVTIVVLLILAGVTIMYVMSDNGIFGQAQSAGTETNQAAVKEAVETAIAGLYPLVYTSEATDDATLSGELQTKWEEGLSSTMKNGGDGYAIGTITAKKGSVKDLALNGCVIVYKGVKYGVSYDNSGVTVVPGATTSAD